MGVGYANVIKDVAAERCISYIGGFLRPNVDRYVSANLALSIVLFAGALFRRWAILWGGPGMVGNRVEAGLEKLWRMAVKGYRWIATLLWPGNET